MTYHTSNTKYTTNRSGAAYPSEVNAYTHGFLWSSFAHYLYFWVVFWFIFLLISGICLPFSFSQTFLIFFGFTSGLCVRSTYFYFIWILRVMFVLITLIAILQLHVPLMSPLSTISRWHKSKRTCMTASVHSSLKSEV
jgi:hypothetical protein